MKLRSAFTQSGEQLSINCTRPRQAGTTSEQSHHWVASYSEVGHHSSLDRRLVPVRVYHSDVNGRVHHSFFLGICQREPLTALESSAFLLIFPYAPDGTYREAPEPAQIRLNGYAYKWYWCGTIVASGHGDTPPSNLNASDFLARVAAFEHYLVTGDTQRILALMPQEITYRGYFSA